MSRKLPVLFVLAIIATMSISLSASAHETVEHRSTFLVQATANATEAATAEAAGDAPCIAASGPLAVEGASGIGIWSVSRVLLITGDVENCTVKHIALMLNPAMVAQQGANANELFVLYIPDTAAIQGNQFSLTTDPTRGSVTIKGTFTSSADVEGMLIIPKGTKFPSSLQPLNGQTFNKDFTDTWKGILQGAPRKLFATAAATQSSTVNHDPVIAKNATVTTTTDSDMTGSITGVTTRITIDASDPDGDVLQYSWTASNGTITGSGPSGTWQRELTSDHNNVVHGTVTVTVSDGHGGKATYTYSDQ